MFSFVFAVLIILSMIAAAIVVIRRKKANKPAKPFRVFSLAILIAFAMGWIYGILMPQSYILRFDTPEKAYRFTNEMDCTYVVYGEDSALAIGVNEDRSVNPLLVIKDGEGWKVLPMLLSMPRLLALHEGMRIYLWDECPADIYAVVEMTSFNPSSTKQFMLNDQTTSAEIIKEDTYSDGYNYHLYYRLDGNTKEIAVSIDGEPYITVPINAG